MNLLVATHQQSYHPQHSTCGVYDIKKSHTGQSGQHKQIHKQMLGRMRRKENPSALLVGMQTGEATVENSMEFPQKTENGTALWSSNSAAGIIP